MDKPCDASFAQPMHLPRRYISEPTLQFGISRVGLAECSRPQTTVLVIERKDTFGCIAAAYS
jgi:hypothetical protein